ncbi:MAG: protein kinase, partial [Minicystis sp.]
MGLPENVFKPGDRVDGYRIVKLRERGGMSEVYDAVGEHAGEPVILKCIRRVLIDRDDVLERIMEESKVCARLRHPNIVHMYRAGATSLPLAGGSARGEGRRMIVPYLVMEPIEGVTLKRLVEESDDPGSTLPRLPLPIVLDIMIQLSTAVRFMHKKGIVHRDLKPTNIMIGASGHVWVLDFGLAKFTTGGLDSADLPSMGTLGYMAPEQLNPGKKLTADARVDLWALGTIFYVLIAGENPFEPDADSTDSERIAANLFGDPEPLPDFIPSCPAPVWAIIARCLRKNRDERYPSADELLRDLHVEAQRHREPPREVSSPRLRAVARVERREEPAPMPMPRETTPMSPDFQPDDPLRRFRAPKPAHRPLLNRTETAPLPRDFRPASPHAPRAQGFTEPIRMRVGGRATAKLDAALELDPSTMITSPSSGIRSREETPVTMPSVGSPQARPALVSAANPSFPLYLTPVAGLLLA